MATPNPAPSGRGRPRGAGGFGWRAFFQQSSTPVFVLGKGKRLRFANAAWEKLTGAKLSDALGMVCSSRKSSTLLQAALAPTPEAMAGRADRARRPAPPHRNGPPWWDVSFAPLQSEDGIHGVVGFIAVVGEPVPAAARKVPPGVAALRDECARHSSVDLLAGESLASARLVAQARLAAQLTAPVWIAGGPGSGKETTARVIHHASSLRDRAFVAIDCTGLQPYLVEGLLFGHGGLGGSDRVGTVYLKEPAELPRDLQERLAGHFAENPAVRLVCGSTSTAAESVAAGALVPAYQSALSAFEIRMPPLRDRPGDLPRLASRIVPDRALDPAALAVLRAHAWPGNLRELREVLTGAATLAPSGPILRDHLPLELRLRSETPRTPPARPLDLDAILAAVEKKLIELALRKADGNQTEAAALLGVFRTRLARRIESLGVPAKKE
jgi:transcriptional regulator with PAS, ATPase and Fis domain